MPAAERKRSCKLVREDGFDIVVITEVVGSKKKTDYYRLEINRNAPNSWRLHKCVHSDEDATVYDTQLDGSRSLCTCIGFEQYGYCRHITSLQALSDAGKLPK